MAYFPHAYQKLLVATGGFYSNAGDIASAVLSSGQLAVVDASTNLTVDISTTPAFGSAPKMIYLAQGSFHANDKIGPFHGGYQETVKSKGINPKYVSAFYRVDDMAAKNNIIQVCAAACNLTCNTTYRLRIDVKGSPALRLLTRNAYFTADAKTSCCDATIEDQIMDPTVVMLGWADRINTYPIISKFVQPHVWVNNITGGMGASGSITGAVVNTNTIDVTGLAGTPAVNQKIVIANGSESYTAYVADFDGTDTIELMDAAGNTFVNPVSYVGWSITCYEEVTSDGSNGLFDQSTSAYTEETNQTTLASLLACIDLVGAYVDTKFGDCSFRPTDHFELQPIQIYASTLDENEDPCDSLCFTTSTVQEAFQGKGYGETFLRELILAKQYQQEWWTNDVRLREVLDNTSLTEISRNGKYVVYNILHSVPRKSNPNGMMDNDQYLVRVVCASDSPNFEAYINNLLDVNLNPVQLEVKL